MDITHLILPLLITIVIEFGVLLLLCGFQWKVLLASIPINIATNVPLNLYVQQVDSSVLAIIIGELIVIVVEALCYYLLLKDLKQAFIYSLFCNITSVITGLLLEVIYFQFIA